MTGFSKPDREPRYREGEVKGLGQGWPPGLRLFSGSGAFLSRKGSIGTWRILWGMAEGMTIVKVEPDTGESRNGDWIKAMTQGRGAEIGSGSALGTPVLGPL